MTITSNLKLISSVSVFIILVIVGIILHRSGKPYQPLTFNLHKLLTIVWIILMVGMLRSLSGELFDMPLLYISLGITALGILILMFSGGMMSLDRMHELMLKVHRLTTGVVIFSLPVLIYSLILNNPNTI